MTVVVNTLNSQFIKAPEYNSRIDAQQTLDERQEQSEAGIAPNSVDESVGRQVNYEKVYAKAQSLFGENSKTSSNKVAAYDAVSKQLGRQQVQEWLAFSTYA